MSQMEMNVENCITIQHVYTNMRRDAAHQKSDVKFNSLTDYHDPEGDTGFDWTSRMQSMPLFPSEDGCLFLL